MTTYQLNVVIGPDSPPELVAAVRTLVHILGFSPELIDVDETASAPRQEIETVNYQDLADFLFSLEDPDDPQARSKATKKAKSALAALLISHRQGDVRHEGSRAQLKLVCPYCHLSHDLCQHALMQTSNGTGDRTWSVRAPWGIGVESLVMLTEDDLHKVPRVSRQRILDWIEHLKTRTAS